MHAVEFTTELSGTAFFSVPKDAVAKLPKSGKARVIVLTVDDPEEDAEWRLASYRQFLRDDSPEDAVYDGLR